MSVFDAAVPSEASLEQDIVRKWTIDTGVTTLEVKTISFVESSGGALMCHVVLWSPADSKSIRLSDCVVSGNAKGNKTTYTDKRSGKQFPLPGFQTMHDMCTVLFGKSILECPREDKSITVSRDKSEIRKCIVVPPGTMIKGGVIEVLENRQEKQGNDYVDIDDSRLANYVTGWFDANTNLSAGEIAKGASSAVDMGKWSAYNKGQINRYTPTGNKAGGAGSVLADVANAFDDEDEDEDATCGNTAGEEVVGQEVHDDGGEDTNDMLPPLEEDSGDDDMLPPGDFDGVADDDTF